MSDQAAEASRPTIETAYERARALLRSPPGAAVRLWAPWQFEQSEVRDFLTLFAAEVTADVRSLVAEEADKPTLDTKVRPANPEAALAAAIEIARTCGHRGDLASTGRDILAIARRLHAWLGDPSGREAGDRDW
jgi:hypothetical protein